MGLFFNFFVATFAAVGSFLAGYDSGIIGPVISPNYKYFHSYFDNPNDQVLGAVLSTFAGGGFFGAMSVGFLADRIGRKRTIQVGSIIAMLGNALQTSAQNIDCLIAGRIVAGFATGCLTVVVPLYQSEIAPAELRGFLIGMTQFMIGMGFLVANWVGYGCQFLDSEAQWRIPLGIQAVPALLLFLGMCYLPCSPRWLIEKRRYSEAKIVILRLHGTKGNAELDFKNMVNHIEGERGSTSSKLSDLWSTAPMRKRTFTAMAIQICCHFTGINISAYFQPSLYAALGYSGDTILLITAINNALAQIVGFAFIYFILDRVGRRLPLIIGAFGMALCLAVVAAINARFPSGSTHNKAAQQAGVAFIVLFSSLFFPTSFGPIPWVYQSEIFPMRVRAMGASVATMSNWAANVLLSQISPMGLHKLGWKFYLVFICTNVANGFIVIAFLPETKGRTLEEMNEVFGEPANKHPLEAKCTLDTASSDGKHTSVDSSA